MGGTVAAAVGPGADELLGLSKRNCCIASPAQMLVWYCVRMFSQIRRASSFRFFAFRMYTCDSKATGALKPFGLSDATC